MSTAHFDYEYWPFPVDDANTALPDVADKIAFMQQASDAGAESYKFGINNFGARFAHRSGIIMERGRHRWELRLSQGDQRCISAFTRCFVPAGNAVMAWLEGDTISAVLQKLTEHLVVPPGMKASYTIHDPLEP